MLTEGGATVIMGNKLIVIVLLFGGSMIMRLVFSALCCSIARTIRESFGAPADSLFFTNRSSEIRQWLRRVSDDHPDASTRHRASLAMSIDTISLVIAFGTVIGGIVFTVLFER